MFELLDEHSHEIGSQDRYNARPRHLIWWLIHNCIAHPLIGIFPVRWFFQFHDWTSQKINAPKSDDDPPRKGWSGAQPAPRHTPKSPRT